MSRAYGGGGGNVLCPARVTMTTGTGAWFPVWGDLVGSTYSATGTATVTHLITTITLSNNVGGIMTFLDTLTFASPAPTVTGATVSPATQSNVSAENNDMSYNALGTWYSAKASADVRFRNTGGAEQGDYSLSAVLLGTTAVPILTANTYGFSSAPFVSGKKFLITRFTAQQTGGGSTCKIQFMLNGTVAIAAITVPAGSTATTQVLPAALLVDGTTTPQSIGFQFTSACSGITAANIQYDGEKYD